MGKRRAIRSLLPQERSIRASRMCVCAFCFLGMWRPRAGPRANAPQQEGGARKRAQPPKPRGGKRRAGARGAPLVRLGVRSSSDLKTDGARVIWLRRG